MVVDLANLLPGAVGSALAFAVTWGAMRATLGELRREVTELKTVNATITGLDKRQALMEADVKRLDEGQRSHHQMIRVLQRWMDRSGAVEHEETKP